MARKRRSYRRKSYRRKSWRQRRYYKRQRYWKRTGRIMNSYKKMDYKKFKCMAKYGPENCGLFDIKKDRLATILEKRLNWGTPPNAALQDARFAYASALYKYNQNRWNRGNTTGAGLTGAMDLEATPA
jgi:hypothetical protein